MNQLDHLTSEELSEKFSTFANYAVLVGESTRSTTATIYSVLLVLFGLSGLIGVYFWRKGDQTTPEETLLGKKLTGNSQTENDKDKGWWPEIFLSYL